MKVLKTMSKKFCDSCEKNISASNWSYHIKTDKHLNGKPKLLKLNKTKKVFNCPECDYNSIYKQTVETHYKAKHTDEKVKKVYQFHCSLCDIDLFDNSALNIHVNSKKHYKLAMKDENRDKYCRIVGNVTINEIDECKKYSMIKDIKKTHVRKNKYSVDKEDPDEEDEVNEEKVKDEPNNDKYDALKHKLKILLTEQLKDHPKYKRLFSRAVAIKKRGDYKEMDEYYAYLLYDVLGI